MARRIGFLGYKYASSLSGPSACTVPARSLYDCCHITNSLFFAFPLGRSPYTTCVWSEVELHNKVLFCSVLFCSIPKRTILITYSLVCTTEKRTTLITYSFSENAIKSTAVSFCFGLGQCTAFEGFGPCRFSLRSPTLYH